MNPHTPMRLARVRLSSLPGAAHVALEHVHPREVRRRAYLLVGVCGGRDLHRLLQVGDAASVVAGDDPRDAEGVEVPRSGRPEVHGLGQAKRLGGELDRPREVVGHHQCASELLQDEGLGRGRATVGHELSTSVKALQRAVAVATIQPNASQPSLRLGGGLDLARTEQALRRVE
jgi:hypothetical protein